MLGTAQWSFLQTSPRVAHIYGTKGNIAVERVNCPERLTLNKHGGETKVGMTPFTVHAGCVWTLFLLTLLACISSRYSSFCIQLIFPVSTTAPQTEAFIFLVLAA